MKSIEEQTRGAGSRYASENWKVLEKPNEYDNAHDDFIAGANWERNRDKLLLEQEWCNYMIADFPLMGWSEKRSKDIFLRRFKELRHASNNI